MQSLICSEVTKTYDGLTALSEVGLALSPGERVALLGHNGAGKSTLMKIILGLIPATSGEVRVLGGAPGSHAAREGTAYLPENAAFHPALTGLEQLRFYMRLRGANPKGALALLEKVDLA